MRKKKDTLIENSEKSSEVELSKSAKKTERFWFNFNKKI